MAGINDLNVITQAFLDAAVDALNATDAGAPGRRYIAPGEPALDCCLPGSALVSTEYGPRPISDIRAGDRIWAQEEGHLVLRQVMRQIPKGEREIFAVKSPRRTLRATADHEVLVLEALGRVRDESGRYGRVEWSREWRRVDELKRGDQAVALARLNRSGSASRLPDGSDLDEKVAWLLGLWIGDGSFNGQEGLCFFVHNSVRSKAAEIIERTWGVKPREDSQRIMLNSRELCPMFEEVFSRSHAAGKTVPEIIWSATSEVRRAFLHGYAAADGDITSRGYQRYSSASATLIAQTRAMHIELGDAVSNVSVQKRRQPIIIKGNAVRSALPLYRFSHYPDSPRTRSELLNARGARRAIPDEQLGAATVQSVEPDGVEQTFDLQIEGAHNFIADGIVVHNCGQLTVWLEVINRIDLNAGPGALATMKAINRGGQPVLTIFVQATRCQIGIEKLSASDLPKPEDMTATAHMVDQDGWALHCGFMNALRHGELAEVCSGAEMIGGQKLLPQGGCVGWTFQFRYPIAGGLLT